MSFGITARSGWISKLFPSLLTLPRNISLDSLYLALDNLCSSQGSSAVIVMLGCACSKVAGESTNRINRALCFMIGA